MEIYLVGGAVRDELLGLEVKDRDWVVVGATPDEMLARGFKPVGQDFPVFLHPDSGEEYALARTERKSGKGYTGFTFHASPEVSLEDDLVRRDLTINAIARSENGELHDPWGGRRDLEQRLLRHVSPAFVEDPLRVLRVARFYARFAHLGFTVADETLALMRELSQGDELDHLTPERVWQECQRALATQSPAHFFRLLQEVGALSRLLPHSRTLDCDRLLQLSTQLPGALPQPAERVFALLTWTLTEQLEQNEAQADITELCLQLRIPNRFRDLALKVRQYAEALSQFDRLDGEQRLQLLKGLDLLRRPELLDDLVSITRAIFPSLPNGRPSALQRLLKAIKVIDSRALMAEGYKGKALGEALALRQQQLCSEYHEGDNR
ncbi:tRNA nucleotidyltransferase (CCA-adding enzyme) [Marinobacterium sediminicola]|uniref:CCA-adding enzyme n=2 Tax=Marinobacterium sediminicola TaxID=518898 RepID=A0ABY1RYE6_9GAMM|nr:tRNA nucleotidyltransferase (CCA-adding enzyme) [Marinobacterium sediminicola]